MACENLADVIGPDPMYQLTILKDYSKANKSGRPELLGVTRAKNPLTCPVNAVATILILRFAKQGLRGGLPPIFDVFDDCWEYSAFFTRKDGEGKLPYKSGRLDPGHWDLFKDMKSAAGLVNIMDACATKLRSFGAMKASQKQADNMSVMQAGRQRPSQN